ncbi:hypothetical protein Smic_34540 [Streptomyces microflavus]|uniref:Uncharacterized protein n=1 Tax=Streptomyces microflavus TaxID=1919 RepID=A0A7J0CRC8_STRMI|nr:hypothetical protein Smic_34540 [Streptomyces microflavus]
MVQRQARVDLPRPEADGQARAAPRARDGPSTAGGPPRTEYEVTEEGLAEYRTLLRDAIRSYDQNLDVLSAAIGFIVDLPREEAVALLKERIEGMKEWRDAVTEYYTPEDGPESLGHIGEIMNLWVHSADTGAEWTRGLIERIEGGAYTFAGEGDPFVGVLAEGEENPYATGVPDPGDND